MKIILLTLLLFSNTHVVLAAELPAMAEGLEKIQSLLDLVWVLLAAVLVFIMQAGFLCLEAGLARAKNSINVAIKNLGDLIISVVGFWVIGFGLMFGASWSGYLGFSEFFMDSADSKLLAFFLFQAMFAGTAATIDSGALAGRTKFGAYLTISALTSILIYPVFGHWSWGSLLLSDQQGWLEAIGFKDFAGSTVVHSVGGWVALAGVIVVGPRIGKFDKNGIPRRISPHNMTLAYLGTFILFFGWFGFNAGSTLEVSTDIAGIAVNTLIAACFGGISCSALSWYFSELKRPEGEMIINGVLGGLVGITAGCAFVGTMGAAIIGLISGIVVYNGVHFIERKLKLDDVVGAIAVHGFCGAWGTMAVGIFILPEHLGEMSRWSQILAQLTGVVAGFVWAFGAAYIILTITNKFMGGLRVSQENEMVGLNISEHGASSGLLDVIQTMHNVSNSGRFSIDMKVEVEIGTEAGDLAMGFNRMIDAITRAQSEQQKQEILVRQAMAELETERTALQESLEEILKHEATKQAQEELDRVREERQKFIVRSASQMEGIVKDTEGSFSHISNAAGELSTSVKKLENQWLDMQKVLNFITKLGRQVNILALNATIVAESSGNTRNAFIAISKEIRSLADETNRAAEEASGFLSGMRSILTAVLAGTQTQNTEIEHGKAQIDKAKDIVIALIRGEDETSEDMENLIPDG